MKWWGITASPGRRAAAKETGGGAAVSRLQKVALMQLPLQITFRNFSPSEAVVDRIRAKVQELFGVSPEQIPDLLGLWGDSSDNVPGAPGIGEKTAKDLIQRFGSIEATLERAGEVGTFGGFNHGVCGVHGCFPFSERTR